ncbi:Rtr1/RPAP2 family-domain-containing protein [Achaetomium macrosporum]|uniref:RNA polymerase II subunit B1 CTD phosphatase RPAP2 homolog n=1 Tax=Achaetomium macrosporum TaxID=79813 RepID=A0AAN7C611_9PEZI|nr:Rtr1/RPAP2 family-domain-containing protein [Achaetomium macrosporum]
MSAESNPSSKPKPKGILKKKPNAAPPTSPSPRPPPPSQSEEPLQELTRAELLLKQEAAARLRLYQKLRDTELKPPVPLETFELLCQFPRGSPDPPPAHAPSESDVRDFLSALSDFQPSEYMDLIEERNCLGKCGYTLCPRPRRTHAGGFKLSARTGGIARTADLNKWCSDACAERALYLKVQLDNPTYVRREADGRLVVKLELREERGRDGERKEEGRSGEVGGGNTTARPARGSEGDREELAVAMAQLEIRKVKQAKASDLALERGDPGGLFAGVGRVDVAINENSEVKPPRPPSPSLLKENSHTIEGYRTTYGINGQTSNAYYQKPDEGADSDDDDAFPTIHL